MGLLPSYIENTTSSIAQEKKAVPREYEIDFTTGQLTGGIVEGKEAIKTWIWLVLQTPRYRYYAYTWDYGHELEELIGQGYSSEYIDSECRRMIEDCLLVNEDILNISDFCIDITGNILSVTFTADTIYGDIKFNFVPA